VPEFVEPKKWPLNSPNSNPVVYSIWGALQQLVYRRHRIRDAEHLKEVLQTYWEQIGQDVIDRGANLLGADRSRCYRSRYRTALQTIVIRCCNQWRTHWTLIWLMFLVLHVRYHTYVFCCRNTELGQQNVNSLVYSAPPSSFKKLLTWHK